MSNNPLRICTLCGHEECPRCRGVGNSEFGRCDNIETTEDDVKLCCEGEMHFWET